MKCFDSGSPLRDANFIHLGEGFGIDIFKEHARGSNGQPRKRSSMEVSVLQTSSFELCGYQVSHCSLH